MSPDLAERWERLRDRLSGGRPVTLPEARFAYIARRYGEPHRAYHDLGHVEHCLRELDSVRGLLRDPDAAELALWYHDLVHEPLSLSNERRSAEIAARVARACGLPEGRVERVRRLIRLTRGHRGAVDEDERIFLDVDLSILGQDPETFARYLDAVRKEYRRLPDWLYRRLRRAFLKGLLRRPRIFQSEAFHARYEARARANLEAAVGALDGRGSRS